MVLGVAIPLGLWFWFLCYRICAYNRLYSGKRGLRVEVEMNTRLVQLGELVPFKGIWYQVIDASGQHAGYPERLVLRPHSPTMSSLKKAALLHQREKRK